MKKTKRNMKSKGRQVLDPKETKKLLKAAPRKQPAYQIHLVKSGLSKVLSRYKNESGKTLKEIGEEMKLSESIVSRMVRAIDGFTIDFFIEHLSKIKDTGVKTHLDEMVNHSFLGQPNPFASENEETELKNVS